MLLGLCRIDSLGVLSGAPMDVQWCTHTTWNGLFLLFYFIFPIVYIGWLVVIGYALTKYVMLMAFILKLLKHI